MDSEDRAKEIREDLSVLVGHKLVRSRRFCATRHFYFGQGGIQAEAPVYTLGLECAWRIQKQGHIVVGSDDYGEKAEDETNGLFESGIPIGDLQDQKIVELLDEFRAGSTPNAAFGLRVEFVEADEVGGFRIGFGKVFALEVFPTSVGQMEWIFSSPRGGSLILMNGVLNRSGKMD